MPVWAVSGQAVRKRGMANDRTGTDDFLIVGPDQDQSRGEAAIPVTRAAFESSIPAKLAAGVLHGWKKSCKLVDTMVSGDRCNEYVQQIKC